MFGSFTSIWNISFSETSESRGKIQWSEHCRRWVWAAPAYAWLWRQERPMEWVQSRRTHENCWGTLQSWLGMMMVSYNIYYLFQITMIIIIIKYFIPIPYNKWQIGINVALVFNIDLNDPLYFIYSFRQNVHWRLKSSRRTWPQENFQNTW